ncbi:MAG TPA: MBL fold metallo-hydrolase [Chitinophagaceae bacterium]|nr:MBL fold metallo-hydrolase [Chitinophagaceae bacterium]
MHLFTASLNSGSNGNCYYVGNDHEAVLIDAGISCKEVEKRMERLGLTMGKVKAIFVSHEHSDHIFGIPVLAKKYRIPVYITSETLRQSRLRIDNDLTVQFTACDPVIIGGLTVHAFPKCHDACDPHSFIVTGNSVMVGIFTDIGNACEQVTYHFKLCHAAFLEANYDDQMLSSGNYPAHLKKRISGKYGHLSNAAAYELFQLHRPAYMSHLFLSHLSKNNNCPELVQQLFSQRAERTEVIVATRFAETSLYKINNTGVPVFYHPLQIKPKAKSLQLSMF